VFFCGIARNQDQMLDLFEKVFLLVIDAGTQMARPAGPAHVTSPGRVGSLASSRWTNPGAAYPRDGAGLLRAQTADIAA
jgi:hypothetical protein